MNSHPKKILLKLIISLTFIIPLQVNAWFIIIPGFVTRAISDAITGSKGNICVKDTTKVGDIITSPVTENTARIISLSGTSTTCNNPALPIRSEIEFNYTFSTNAAVALPDDYESIPTTDLERFNGTFLKVKSKTQSNQGIVITSYKRRTNLEISQMANNIELSAKRNQNLKDAISANPEKLVINDMPAIRFEITGTLKGLFGTKQTYLYTLLQGDKEILVINSYTPTDKFEITKLEFNNINEKISGINSPIAPTPLVEKLEASDMEIAK